MVDIFLLKQQLSAEQNKVLDEVLFEMDNTEMGYKILNEEYKDAKKKVKSTMKKLSTLKRKHPDARLTAMSIEGKIYSIENKYPALDKAIKRYKEEMKYFNGFLGSPYLRTFSPTIEGDYHIWNMKKRLRNANFYIEQGMNAIRITKNYFKDIARSFESNADYQKFQKELQKKRAKMEAANQL